MTRIRTGNRRRVRKMQRGATTWDDGGPLLRIITRETGEALRYRGEVCAIIDRAARKAKP